MLNSSYIKRLERDLGRWVEKGWVGPQSRAMILADAEKPPGSSRFPAVMGILGAILLATGVMTFVSANWQEMSKFMRLVILFGVMWSAFAAAVWLKRTAHEYMMEGVLFLCAGMFGVNIMLIAQIYHIDGDYSDAVFLWIAGALLTAFILESRAALALGFVLLPIWSGGEVFEFGAGFHWAFLPVWLIATALVWWMAWRPGLHLALLTFAFWLVIWLAKMVDIFNWHPPLAVAALAIAALALFVLSLVREKTPRKYWLGFENAFKHYTLLAVFAAGFFMQFALEKQYVGGSFFKGDIAPLIMAVIGLGGVIWASFAAKKLKLLALVDVEIITGMAIWLLIVPFIAQPVNIWLHAFIYLGFCVWAVGFTQKHRVKAAGLMALIAFSAEVLYIYFKTLGDLLGTAVFFFLGGVLLIAMALGFGILRRRFENNRGDENDMGAGG